MNMINISRKKEKAVMIIIDEVMPRVMEILTDLISAMLFHFLRTECHRLLFSFGKGSLGPSARKWN